MKKNKYIIIVCTLCFFVAAILLLNDFSVIKDYFLQFKGEGETLSEFIRNMVLPLSSLIGLSLLTWRSVIADKTHKQDIKAHMTDMYIKAVAQLASDKEAIRLAGTVGLVQILEQAKSQADKGTENNILEVLWCFMVEHSRDILKQYQQAQGDCQEDQFFASRDVLNHKKYYAQFKQIIPILPNKDHSAWWQEHSWKDIFLCKINLSYVNLSYVNLSYADLSGADLSRAKLFYAKLSGVDLSYVNLSDANLSGVKLFDANLSGANLSGAKLLRANLSGANLSGAKLLRANLFDANLSGANLSDANLSDTNLLCADLYGTKYNNRTKFPKEFNPQDYGMINLDETEQKAQADSECV